MGITQGIRKELGAGPKSIDYLCAKIGVSRTRLERILSQMIYRMHEVRPVPKTTPRLYELIGSAEPVRKFTPPKKQSETVIANGAYAKAGRITVKQIKFPARSNRGFSQ